MPGISGNMADRVPREIRSSRDASSNYYGNRRSEITDLCSLLLLWIFDLLLGLDGKEQEISEGVVGDGAVRLELAISVDGLGQPDFYVSRPELNRRVVEDEKPVADVGLRDFFHEAGLDADDFAGIGSDPGAAFQPGGIDRATAAERERAGRLVL